MADVTGGKGGNFDLSISFVGGLWQDVTAEESGGAAKEAVGDLKQHERLEK